MCLKQHEVVLINPSVSFDEAQTGYHQNVKQYGLLAFLGNLGVEVRLLDAQLHRLTPDEILSDLKKRPASVVVVDLFYRTLPFVEELFKKIEASSDLDNVFYVLTGLAATLSTNKILFDIPRVNAIALGENEYTLLELIEAIKHKRYWKDIQSLAYMSEEGEPVTNPARDFIKDLDILPFAVRDNLKYLAQVESVEISSSRGCDSSCSFCVVRPFNSQKGFSYWRPRSAENVVEEIKFIIDQYNCFNFQFVDDCFFGNGKNGYERAHTFAENILKLDKQISFSFFCRSNHVESSLFKKLKQAGLHTVNIGFESASQRILDKLNKRSTVEQSEEAILILKKLGIRIVPSFILFEPTITLNEIRDTLIFMIKHGFQNSISPSVVIPFEKTLLGNNLIKTGLVDFTKYTLFPYLNDIKYVYHEVALLRMKWLEWIDLINRNYNNLHSAISKINHYFLESFIVDNKAEWNCLQQLVAKLNEMEIQYILSLIEELSSENSWQNSHNYLKPNVSCMLDRISIEISDIKADYPEILESLGI